MENLNGRKRVEEGKLCDRRNGRGVDLNRNWSVDWGKKEKVSILVVSHCAMEKSNSSWRQLYADSFKIYLELNLC